MTLSEFLTKLGNVLRGSALTSLGQAVNVITGETAPQVDVVDNPFPITSDTAATGLMAAYTGPSLVGHVIPITNKVHGQLTGAYRPTFNGGWITGITAQSAGSTTISAVNADASVAISGGVKTSAQAYTPTAGYKIGRLFYNDVQPMVIYGVGALNKIEFSLNFIDAAQFSGKTAYLRHTSEATTTGQISLGSIPANGSITKELGSSDIQALLGHDMWYICVAN